MWMKTNDHRTICPTQNRHFNTTVGDFTRKHTYFAETIGPFVAIRALRNESSLQNVNSRLGRSIRAFRDLPGNTVLRLE